jgi:O-antigen ligase
MAACVAIFAIVKWDLVSKLFVRSIMQNLTNGSGRLDLWAEGLVAFSENPVFGKGFYVDLYGDPGFAGMDIIPLMYHNTVIQLLGACGTLGLLTYAIHRTQTVISLIKNITVERLFITISILGLLICNLFDNHLFYILPTILYSMLLSVLIKGEKVTHIE